MSEIAIINEQETLESLVKSKIELTPAQKIIQKAGRKKKILAVVQYTILILTALFMLYPLLWIVGASFSKGSHLKFWIVPDHIWFKAWKDAWSTPGWAGKTMFRALWNTMQYVIPHVLFMTFTTLITAFAVTRTRFKGRKIVFACIIGTLLMPNTIFRIPLYAFWQNKFIRQIWLANPIPFMGYLPLWGCSLFATNSFSIFMYIQFFRSIPRELDEAAYIDGANRMQLLFKILVPILQPIVITVALLLFIAAFNDFQGPLIYISTTRQFTVSIVLKLLNHDAINSEAHMYARSLIAMMIPVIVFFSSQKYFVGNIASTGIKG